MQEIKKFCELLKKEMETYIQRVVEAGYITTEDADYLLKVWQLRKELC